MKNRKWNDHLHDFLTESVTTDFLFIFIRILWKISLFVHFVKTRIWNCDFIEEKSIMILNLVRQDCGFDVAQIVDVRFPWVTLPVRNEDDQVGEVDYGSYN